VLVANAEDYRRKSDDLLRQAMKADDLNERGRLISQAVHFHDLAHEAHRLAAEQRRGAATVVSFPPEGHKSR
jgi:hypothetical protein